MNEMTNVQKSFIQYIDNIIKNNKLSHSYLIELDDYDESYYYILSFIKMILCNLSYEEMICSDNPIIHLVDSGQYPDITVVSSNTSVINKSLITKLQSDFNNKSSLDNKRIYIIKEAEKFNPSSANTILKFLEEPEEDIIAILLTNDRYHVIDTILSRCQILTLKENRMINSIDNNTVDLLDLILNPQMFFLKYNSISKELFSDKRVFIDQLHTVEKIILSFLSNNTDLNDKIDISNMLSKYDKIILINILNIIEDEIPKLNYNVNLKLWMDSFFARLIGG